MVCHGIAPSGCYEADQYPHWSGFSTAVVSLSADDDCICLFHEIRCVVQHLVFSPARDCSGWYFQSLWFGFWRFRYVVFYGSGYWVAEFWWVYCSRSVGAVDGARPFARCLAQGVVSQCADR